MSSLLGHKIQWQQNGLHRPWRQAGFTLIELMIVVTIVGLLAAVALPNYQQQVRNGHRKDVQAQLYDIASLQEKYRSEQGSYEAFSAYLSNNGKYDISVAVQESGEAYEIKATARSGSGQDSDSGCTEITLDSYGNRIPSNCWSR